MNKNIEKLHAMAKALVETLNTDQIDDIMARQNQDQENPTILGRKQLERNLIRISDPANQT